MNGKWISSTEYERREAEEVNMSRDPPDRVILKEDQSLFRYCEGNLNFSTANLDEEDFNFHKKKISRDPMSHRIIEKRRRDRMNNCLADLSRLIPADYLKKGRGRIEKTEIIEMAIKHMRHLQSIIASSRMSGGLQSESSEGPVSSCSPPATASPPASSIRQPIVIEHYRLGYLECLSEAMHFLVEVQGYFAGDSLCVQMINHLHKHCDKILKGDGLNFPRKHTRETSSNSSTSTTAGNYSNNSPPLGMSNSTGSNSDDNQGCTGQYEQEYHPERRYAEMCYPLASQGRASKRSSEPFFPRYPEDQLDERVSENRSDSDPEQNFVVNPRNPESKCYIKGGVDYIPRNYSISSGIGSGEGTFSYDDVTVKEENPDGLSQLREMLTSPKSIPSASLLRSEIKGNTSPLSHTSGCETASSQVVSPGHADAYQQEAVSYKTQSGGETSESGHSPESCNPDGSDNHSHMYKFKNNIKQRFSKETHFNEKRALEFHDAPDEVPLKKQKTTEDYPHNYSYDKDKIKYPDSLTRERLHLLDRHEMETEKVRADLRFTTTIEFETKKRSRYASESEAPSTGDCDAISTRLSFGHKSTERSKRWEDSGKYPKLKLLSPNPAMPGFGNDMKKSPGLLATGEAAPLISNKFNKLTISSGESVLGIPIFALHANGSYYIPLTLDHSALTPFLAALGVTKSDVEPEHKAVLHPVTISVNFQTQIVPKDVKSVVPWKCSN